MAETIKKPRNLTPKQQKLVDVFPGAESNADAVRKAGYKGKYTAQNADRILKSTKVRQALNEKQAKVSEKADFDAEKLIEEFKINKELAQADRQYAAANGSLDSIGKIIGAFKAPVDDNKAEEIEQGILDRARAIPAVTFLRFPAKSGVLEKKEG